MLDVMKMLYITFNALVEKPDTLFSKVVTGLPGKRSPPIFCQGHVIRSGVQLLVVLDILQSEANALFSHYPVCFIRPGPRVRVRAGGLVDPGENPLALVVSGQVISSRVHVFSRVGILDSDARV